MGLRVVEEQRQQIQKAADKGVLVYTTMATNPANNICTIDSVDRVALRGYLGSGGRRNYKNMLNYIRKNMDKKLISVEEPGAPIERSSDVLYHVDMDKPGDELDFISVEEYEKYLKSKQLYKEGAKKIVEENKKREGVVTLPSGLQYEVITEGNITIICKEHNKEQEDE